MQGCILELLDVLYHIHYNFSIGLSSAMTKATMLSSCFGWEYLSGGDLDKSRDLKDLCTAVLRANEIKSQCCKHRFQSCSCLLWLTVEWHVLHRKLLWLQPWLQISAQVISRCDSSHRHSVRLHRPMHRISRSQI